jgi:hypothetical protein
VLFAFTIGTFFGLFNATVLAFTLGIFNVLMHPGLVMLWPTSVVAMTDLGGPPGFFTLLIIVGLVSNAILYGFVFAIPVGLVVAFRRSFGEPEKPPSIGRT